MLRTVGSTLLAKANPGGALRKAEEQNIENPALPGKGAIGTISRAGLEQPIERQVPPGSTKVVSSAPAVESTVAPGGILPTQPIPDTGVGMPGAQAPVAPSTPARGPSAAPNVGYLPPTLRSTQAAPAKTVSGGALANAAPSVKTQQEMGVRSQVQGAPGESMDIVKPFVSVAGGKVMADEGKKLNVLRPTTLQEVAGGAGKVISTIGNALNAPQLTPGGLGAKLQTFGGAPSVAKAGVGSVSKAVQQVASNLRSYNPAQTLQSNINKATSFLRSLFR